MKEIIDLLRDVSWLPYEWDDLGWDIDGIPDGEKCEEFTEMLRILKFQADKLLQDIKN